MFSSFTENLCSLQTQESKLVGCLKKMKQIMNLEEPLLWPVFHVSAAQVKIISPSDPAKSRMATYEEADLQWLCLRANLILDQVLAFTEEKTNYNFKAKLEAAVKRLQQSLDKATFLIGGQSRNESDQLYFPPQAKAKKTKKELLAELAAMQGASGAGGGGGGA